MLPVKEGNIATAELLISGRPWTGEDRSAGGREGACSVTELEGIPFATGLRNASSRTTLVQSILLHVHFDDNPRALIKIISARSTFSAINEEPTDESRYNLLGNHKSITNDVIS